VFHTENTVPKPATENVEAVHGGRVFGCELGGLCSIAQYAFLNGMPEEKKERGLA